MSAERDISKFTHALGMPNGLKPSLIDPYAVAAAHTETTPVIPSSVIRSRYRTLLDTGNPSLQPYLRSKKFVDYMSGVRHPGPVSNRLLTAAERGDVGIFLFGARHAMQMGAMDETFHRLETSTAPAAILEPARALYTERVEEIFRTVTDTSDTSLWRRFLLAHFPTVYYGALAVDNPQEYIKNADRQYERMKRLVERTNPNEFNFLATYLNESDEKRHNPAVATEFDEEISRDDSNLLSKSTGDIFATGSDEEIRRPSKFDRFYRYRRLRDQILGNRNSDETRRRRISPTYIDNTLSYGLQQFESGAVTFDELARIPTALAHANREARSITADSDVDKALAYWLNQVRRGAITFDEFTRLPAALARFEQATGFITTDFLPNHPVHKHLQALLRHNAMLVTPDVPMQLLREGILPTDSLITLVQSESDTWKQHIGELKQATVEGRFDPDNTAQRDLEYLAYLKTLTPYQEASLQRFAQIPFLAESGQVPELRSDEVEKAKTTAYEAARVYWMIRERSEKGRDAIVVGNKRYGKQFVTDPIQPYLDELNGVSLIDAWIRSTPFTFNSTLVIENLFPPDIEQVIKLGTKDIWIVDGTKEAIDNNGNPRFPRADLAYLNWFLAYNAALGVNDPRFTNHVRQLRSNNAFTRLVQHLGKNIGKIPYAITTYSPMASDNQQQIAIGSENFGYVKPNFDDPRPQVILVNPVIIPSPERTPWFPHGLDTYTRGYFDDPDVLVEKKDKLAFTRFGLTSLKNGKTEEQFVRQVQKAMGDNMEEMLHLAAPIQ